MHIAKTLYLTFTWTRSRFKPARPQIVWESLFATFQRSTTLLNRTITVNFSKSRLHGYGKDRHDSMPSLNPRTSNTSLTVTNPLRGSPSLHTLTFSGLKTNRTQKPFSTTRTTIRSTSGTISTISTSSTNWRIISSTLLQSLSDLRMYN